MKRQSHRSLSVFVLLALLLQALVPVGFMPSFGADGKVTMVICAGDTVKTITIDVKNAAGDATVHDEADTNMCPYAPVNTAGDVVYNTALNAFMPVTSGLVDFADLSVVDDLNAATNAPRAPPVLS